MSKSKLDLAPKGKTDYGMSRNMCCKLFARLKGLFCFSLLLYFTMSIVKSEVVSSAVSLFFISWKVHFQQQR